MISKQMGNLQFYERRSKLIEEMNSIKEQPSQGKDFRNATKQARKQTLETISPANILNKTPGDVRLSNSKSIAGKLHSLSNNASAQRMKRYQDVSTIESTKSFAPAGDELRNSIEVLG